MGGWTNQQPQQQWGQPQGQGWGQSQQPSWGQGWGQQQPQQNWQNQGGQPSPWGQQAQQQGWGQPPQMEGQVWRGDFAQKNYGADQSLQRQKQPGVLQETGGEFNPMVGSKMNQQEPTLSAGGPDQPQVGDRQAQVGPGGLNSSTYQPPFEGFGQPSRPPTMFAGGTPGFYGGNKSGLYQEAATAPGYEDPRQMASSMLRGGLQMPGGVRQDPQMQIRGLYQNYLGRQADPSGEAYWLGKNVLGGTSMEDIRQEFMRSPEYRGTQGGEFRPNYGSRQFQSLGDQLRNFQQAGQGGQRFGGGMRYTPYDQPWGGNGPSKGTSSWNYGKDTSSRLGTNTGTTYTPPSVGPATNPNGPKYPPTPPGTVIPGGTTVTPGKPTVTTPNTTYTPPPPGTDTAKPPATTRPPGEINPLTGKPNQYGNPILGTGADRDAALRNAGITDEDIQTSPGSPKGWDIMQQIYAQERAQQMAKPAPFGRYPDGTPKEDPNRNLRLDRVYSTYGGGGL